MRLSSGLRKVLGCPSYVFNKATVIGLVPREEDGVYHVMNNGKFKRTGTKKDCLLPAAWQEVHEVLWDIGVGDYADWQHLCKDWERSGSPCINVEYVKRAVGLLLKVPLFQR